MKPVWTIAAATLVSSTLFAIGCSMMQPVKVSSPPLPEITTLDKEAVAVSRAFVKQITNQMPAWLDDDLARFEQPQLHAVLVDLQACYAARNNDDFLIDVQQLRIDAHTLQTLDNTLKQEWLI